MTTTSTTPPLPVRLVALDAYRGLVLALMMGEALHFCGVSTALPASALWALLCYHQSHVQWVGCSLRLSRGASGRRQREEHCHGRMCHAEPPAEIVPLRLPARCQRRHAIHA